MSLKHNLIASSLGLLSLWIGLQFYASCRDISALDYFPQILSRLTLNLDSVPLPVWLWSCLPTLAHVYGFSLILSGFTQSKTASPLCLVILNLLWEWHQNWSSYDTQATIVAGLLAWATISIIRYPWSRLSPEIP